MLLRLLYVLSLVVLVSGCDLSGSNDDEPPDEVLIEDIVVGTGDPVEPGQTLTVHYVGTLTNGTTFDSSRSRGEPFTFVLGDSRLIAGWNIGIEGMRVGGTREITIPPALAYGNRGVGSIPPNSTLVFEIELLDVESDETS